MTKVIFLKLRKSGGYLLNSFYQKLQNAMTLTINDNE